jgi:hypothetical protein
MDIARLSGNLSAEHLSLAILEVLVHAPEPAQRSVPRVRFKIRLDRAFVERVSEETDTP